MSWVAQDHDPEWPFDYAATDFALAAESTALLVIDIQQGDLVMGPKSFGGEHPALVDYWNRRMADLVIPNTKRLIDAFRQRGLKVVYTRNGMMSSTGDELTERLRPKATAIKDRYPGTSPYEIATEIAPRADELVIDKPISSAFTSSAMDHVLRNMGITDIVITGVATDMCVFGTARVGAELGYNALLCEDACATYTQRAHDDALLMHARVFGRVSTTEDTLAELDMA